MANKSRTVARRSRSSLTWIDFLVIVAIILTFATIVTTTLGHARASTRSPDRPLVTDVSEAPGGHDPAMIKARLRLAQGSPWG